MADTRTPDQRRRIMQSVKTKHTGPEWTVRRILHSQGLRYRLHAKLPGHPDIVFPSKRKAIFVHGCFWHSHGCCKGQAPKSRLDYWAPKLRANVDRDEQKIRELQDLGWTVMTVWQCEMVDPKSLAEKLSDFVLGTGSPKGKSATA